MVITAEQIAACTGCSILRTATWLVPLTNAMSEFNIDTPARQAMFLAQCGHESDGLVFVHELWGNTPQQLTYQGRMGNINPGDGKKYMGRGPIETTGHDNYVKVMMALGIDCVEHPELLEDPTNGARASAYFWQSNGLNVFADSGDIAGCTRRINGGLTGLADRTARWNVAKKAMGVV